MLQPVLYAYIYLTLRKTLQLQLLWSELGIYVKRLRRSKKEGMPLLDYYALCLM